MPWYTAFGNHDPLVQGNFPTSLQLTVVAEGDLKLISPPAGLSQADLLGSLRDGSHATLLQGLAAHARTSAASPQTRTAACSPGAEIIEQHFITTGAPFGHGFTERNRAENTAYYTFDQGLVRFIVLDTVNPNGEADGSLDATQFAWLRRRARGCGGPGRGARQPPHHRLDDQPVRRHRARRSTDSGPRVLGDEVRALVLQHPQVIAWVNGHSHRNQIWAHRRDGRHRRLLGDQHRRARRLAAAVPAGGGRRQPRRHAVDLRHDARPRRAGGVRRSARRPTSRSPASLASCPSNDWQLRDSDLAGQAEARNVELLVGAPPALR